MVTIALLADHPELLPDLAAAYEREWPEWYGVHGDARADLAERSRQSGFPIGLIALEQGRIVGTLAIAEQATPSHRHLSPWIIGLWVEPAHRNQRIGSLLLKAARDHARAAGMAALYVSSAAASDFFKRKGWEQIGVGTTEGGEAVDIFGIALG